jgi:adenine-specific DNA-methyltransferase|tara:strand:+ start:36079 stop:38073 length:1995 start_codon:yes stop_codon:yes gene_type:complete
MKLYNHIKDLLATVPKYSKDGKLFKNVIVEDGLKLNPTLLKLLLNDERSRKHFFQEVDGVTVFDKTKFQQFISNKEFLPDSFTAFSQNIGLTANGKFLTEANEVVLDFPYKDCVLEGGQTKEDQKRKEIFWNETLAPDEIDRLFDPKALTNLKRYDKDGTHDVKEIKDTDNLIIKGNNLLALHSLKKKYRGRVKLIYIDPPYNTGNDSFGYNDSFNTSTWLTFMTNRLKAAKSLLTKDGQICVQINDHNNVLLKLILDEIFGIDNFINLISIRTKSPSGFKTVNAGLFETAEFIYMYANSKKESSFNIQYEKTEYDENYTGFIENINDQMKDWKLSDIRVILCEKYGIDVEKTHHPYSKLKKKIGEDRYLVELGQLALDNNESVFRLTAIGNDAGQETIDVREKSKLESNKVFQVKRENNSDRYIYNGQEMAFYSKKIKSIDGEDVPTTLLTNIWTDIAWEGIASEGGVTLKKGKKPEKLLRRIIEMSTNEKDLVLDFHLGSGTTAAVAHKLNRQYIGIEQLNYGKNDSTIRLQNVINGDTTGISKAVNWQGGGSFVYAELAKNNQNYIDRIQAADSDTELRDLYKELTNNHLISYKVTPEDLKAQNNEFATLSRDDQKKMLIKILDKNELYINYSEMRDVQYKLHKDKAKAQQIFTINDKFYN